MKVSTLLIFICCAIQAPAQEKKFQVRNGFESKVQFWSGAGLSSKHYFLPVCAGVELGFNQHVFGFIYNGDESLFGGEKYSNATVFYGWRTGNKIFSTELGAGAGQRQDLVYGPLDASAHNFGYYTKTVPQLTVMSKSNICARGNGLGVVACLNLSSLGLIYSVHLVAEFGYEFNRNDKPASMR